MPKQETVVTPKERQEIYERYKYLMTHREEIKTTNVITDLMNEFGRQYKTIEGNIRRARKEEVAWKIEESNELLSKIYGQDFSICMETAQKNFKNSLDGSIELLNSQKWATKIVLDTVEKILSPKNNKSMKEKLQQPDEELPDWQTQ